MHVQRSPIITTVKNVNGENMKLTCIKFFCASKKLGHYRVHEAIRVRIKKFLPPTMYISIIIMYGIIPILTTPAAENLQLILVMAKNLQIAPCLLGCKSSWLVRHGCHISSKNYQAWYVLLNKIVFCLFSMKLTVLGYHTIYIAPKYL